MRTLLVVGLFLTATVVLAAPVSADHYTVGKCDVACANVCVADADTRCAREASVCVGFGHQVPQCVSRP